MSQEFSGRPRTPIGKHRFYVGPEQIEREVVSFSTEQWHQLHHVLRLSVGDSVRVFDGQGALDRVVVLTSPGFGQIESSQRQAAEPRTHLVAYPALLQRDKFEQVLQKLTEVGVAAIVPVLTARGLVRELPDERRQTRWRSILREAAEQSGRGIVPRLLPAQPLADAVARALQDGLVVMAYEGERRCSIREALASVPMNVALFVGPEGGYEAAEVELASRLGARLVTLGPRILRTETASPLLAALVLYELGDLSSGQDDDDDTNRP